MKTKLLLLIILGLLVTEVSMAAGLKSCGIELVQGQYAVKDGYGVLSPFSKDLDSILKLRTGYIADGSCPKVETQDLKPCVLEHIEGQYMLKNGGEKLSSYSSDLESILKTRASFVRAEVCSQLQVKDLSSCEIDTIQGRYAIKNGGEKLSLYSTDLDSILSKRASLVDAGVCLSTGKLKSVKETVKFHEAVNSINDSDKKADKHIFDRKGKLKVLDIQRIETQDSEGVNK